MTTTTSISTTVEFHELTSSATVKIVGDSVEYLTGEQLQAIANAAIALAGGGTYLARSYRSRRTDEAILTMILTQYA
jgi:hypothetical protein